MADWEEPLDSQTDPDAPITSQLGKRWDNNVVAMAEGAAGAPPVRGGWYPYDMLSIGDGSTGLLWDVSVDGAVANIDVDIEPGWDYCFRLDQVTTTGTTAASFLSAWNGTSWNQFGVASGYMLNAYRYSGFVIAITPAMYGYGVQVEKTAILANSAYAPIVFDQDMSAVSRSLVSRTKLRLGAGDSNSWTQGKIYFYRRGGVHVF